MCPSLTSVLNSISVSKLSIALTHWLRSMLGKRQDARPDWDYVAAICWFDISFVILRCCHFEHPVLRALYSFGLRLKYNSLFGTIMYSQVKHIVFDFGTESLSQHFFMPKTARTSSRASALPDSEWQMRCMQPPLPQSPLANMEDLQGKNYFAFPHSFHHFNPWISIHQYEGTRTLPVGLPKHVRFSFWECPPSFEHWGPSIE